MPPSDETPASRRRLDFALRVFAVFAAVVLLNALSVSFGSAFGPSPVAFADAVRGSIPIFGAWALLAPAVARILERHPLDPGRIWRSARAHLAWGTLLAAVNPWLAAVLWFLVQVASAGVPSRERFWQTAWGGFLDNLFWNLAVYGVVVAIASAASYRRRYRDRDLEASRLRADLAEARFRYLASQLRPHFLFNTLHSIQTLVREDPRTAERMIVRLSELLRRSLGPAETGGEREVPLGEELDLCLAYLEIERMRRPDELRIEVDVPDETREARVPQLLLQPLVENAVRHGIAPRARGGTVSIRAARRGGRLWIEVADDGVGATPPAGPDQEPVGGVGLGGLAERLRHLYGDAHRLTLDPEPGRGFAVRIELPFRTGGRAR